VPAGPRTSRFGSGVRIRGSRGRRPIVTCLKNPLLLQTDQYSSQAALYPGGILEVKKRFSHHFTFWEIHFQQSHRHDDDFNSDYGPNDQTILPQNVVSLALISGTRWWSAGVISESLAKGRDPFRLSNGPHFFATTVHILSFAGWDECQYDATPPRDRPRELDVTPALAELRQF